MTPERNGRVASLELVRFMAAVSIAWLHMEQILIGKSVVFRWSYIFLEFFFCVTGYYLMAGVDGDARAPERLESVRFSYRKAKAIYPVYLAALLVMFVLNVSVMFPVTGAQEVFSRLFHFKWEFAYLQMLGWNRAPQLYEDFLLLPAWYLSALFLALVPVHFLARKLRDAFSDVVAPLLACAIYYYLCQNYGTVNVGNAVSPLALLGVVRAVAGLSVGAFAFALRSRFVTLKLSPSARRFAAAAEIACFLLVAGMPLFGANLTRHTDALMYIPAYAVLLVVGNSDFSLFNRWLAGWPRGVCVWLGRLSLYLYLFHWGLLIAARDLLKTLPGAWRYAASFAACMLVCVPAMLFTQALTARRARNKNNAGKPINAAKR